MGSATTNTANVASSSNVAATPTTTTTVQTNHSSKDSEKLDPCTRIWAAGLRSDIWDQQQNQQKSKTKKSKSDLNRSSLSPGYNNYSRPTSSSANKVRQKVPNTNLLHPDNTRPSSTRPNSSSRPNTA